LAVDPIPKEVSDFLAAEVRSLVALELLLLLYRDRARLWAIPALARELRSDTEWTQQEVGRLVSRGLAAIDPLEPSLTRCAPLSPNAERALAWLDGFYPERRFSVIQALYAAEPREDAPQPTPTPIQTFADAFKIRKEPPGG